MKKILFLLLLLPLYIIIKAQSVDLNSFFPEHNDKILWNKTISLSVKPDNALADSIFNAAINNLKAVFEPEGNLLVLNKLADYYITEAKDLEKGKNVLEQSEVAFRKVADTISYAFADFYRIKASYFKNTRNTSLFLKAFEDAYTILIKCDAQHPAKPQYEYNLMQAHFLNRSIEDGFYYADLLLKFAAEKNNSYYLASAYLGIANIIKFYNPALAVKFFDYTEFIATYFKDTLFLNDPFFYISIGSGQTAVNQHDKALELYLSGLQILKKQKQVNSGLKASFYYYIGVSFKNMGKNDAAILYLDSAVQAEAIKSNSYYRCKYILGETLNNSKRFEEAIAINEEVLNFYQNTYGKSNTYFTQQAINELARSYQGVGRLDDALGVIHKGICYFLQSNDTLNYYNVPDMTQEGSAKKNYLSLEYAFYRKIEILQDLYLKDKNINWLPVILTHFDAASKVIDINASLLQTTEALYDISDRYKHHANKLLDFIFENDVSDELKKQAYILVAKSKAYALIAENYKNKKNTWQDEDSTNLQKKILEEQLQFLNPVTQKDTYLNVYKQLLAVEKSEFLNKYKAPEKPELISVPLLAGFNSDSIFKRIRKDEIIIDFFITKTKLHAFVFTDKEFYTRSKSLPENFESDCNLLFKAIKLSETENLSKVSAVFRNYVLKDIDLKGKTQLVIIPDEKLYIVPFEILAASSNMLIEQVAVSYRYNSHLFRKSTNSAFLKSFLAFAPVFEDEGLAVIPEALRSTEFAEDAEGVFRDDNHLVPLLATKSEIMGIERFFTSKQIPSKTYIGREATKSTFKEEAQKADVLHIATHGLSNPENHAMSGLFFNNSAIQDDFSEAFLSLTEISNMNLSAELVVLSACKSGYGNILRGEGVMGLSRGFIAAGAKHVLASLWKVHDTKTKDFMILFYGFLFEGYDYPDALRLTKIKCIKKGWQPIDWAGFILIGS